MCKWMALAWHTCSSLPSRAAEDLSMMPPRLSEPCGRGIFWVDFPLCPFCCIPLPLAEGSGHLRKALAKVQGGVPRPPYTQFNLQWVGLHTTVGRECPDFHGAPGQKPKKKEITTPLEHPFLNPEEDPLRNAPWGMVLGIHLHLTQTEEGPTQKVTLQWVRCLAPATA